MPKRKIIIIDESKCNGCALCIPNCSEGAIQIIDQKARLVSDLFCDGLGACIGHCPQGAITIEEREAVAYDEDKVMANIVKQGPHVINAHLKHLQGLQESELSQWPVQLSLVPTHAPYFNDTHLLITADCVPFTYANFHQDLLKGKMLVVGCPKLDDLSIYKEKLEQIFENNNIKSVTYAHMEVPCCLGLRPIIKQAISKVGKKIPFEDITITIKGEKV